MSRHIPVKTGNTPTWAAELTLRERRFVEEYVIDLNGRQAAVRAQLGKTVKSATEIASRMRKKAAVAAAISALMAERGGVTAASVVDEISRIAFAKMTDFMRVEGGRLIIADTAELSEELQSAIAEISETVSENGRTIKVKLHPKLDALDKLAKVLSLYKEHATPPRGSDPQDVDPLDRINARLNALCSAMARPVHAEIDSPVQRAALPPAKAAPLIIDAE